MRELKFRSWDSRNKVMEVIDPLGADCPDLVGRIQDAQYVVMQFTGLLDKHGKEIYEGDIVKYKTNYYGKIKEDNQTVIEWVEDLEHDGFGEPLATGYLLRGYDWEIIGNIYENKPN